MGAPPLTSLRLGAMCLSDRPTLEPRPVSTPDCCCERVLQDSDLVAGSAGGAPGSVIGISREVAMDIVHPRVAGIDVHKKVIWVAVRLPGAAPGERKVIVRSFKTFWRSLQKMAAWLAELGVTDAAMESTGVLVAGLPCPGPDRGDRGVRVQRGAHA